MGFDPAKHHRRSIRLKGHDYSGGGLYFVTLCAHRKAGTIFASKIICEMVAREWESAIGKMGTHKECPYVVMPDHFHALIRIPVGEGFMSAHSLGDVIGAFKSRVVHQMIQMVHAGLCPPFPGKIWHRNYYEMIVRTPEAAATIRNYIRMNPWRCIQQLANGLRGMGNPALWKADKTGILCSRGGFPNLANIPEADVYFGGFHSTPEKRILEELLKRRANIILCPAWSLDHIAGAFLPHLEANRMLILEMKNLDGNLAAAEQRNRFVIQNADSLWTPHITPGGMLDRLLKEP